ncbi:oligosaccharide flippase family protein [Cryomorpha ignava]|uniref:Oligosaccharide flippase family protein n=1 Tax=Cryomorpha ignava TaxID=101383 RepID=A0A7K3WP92_9FLAO|nr:oligosaccharide flippase family protein [Cryomorpha ignava]NEN22555.1 oligosaccharide flippase family protein [Cryomorpha ignava]
MNKLKALLFRSDFTKNVAVMMSGNGLAIIFPFLMAPLISRIYTPDDFAGFELFIKIAALIAVVSALRFEIAILLPRKQAEADAIFKLSIKLLLFISVLSAVIIWPWREEIAAALSNSDLANLLWFAPLAVFFIGGQNVLTQYVIRLQKFKEIASNKVLSSISNSGTSYILGLSAPIAGSLVFGQIAGNAIPAIAFLRLKPIRTALAGTFTSDYSAKYLFKKYRDFPVVNSAHAFFDESQKALLLFIISAYYGEIVLGLFAFAWRYLRVPLQVFGHSLSQVLNEKWARDLNNGIVLKKSLLRTSLGLFAIGLIPFSVLFFFGEPIFTFVFGKDWTMAGTYAAYMAPWLLIHFVISPVSFMPVLYLRQKTNFVFAVAGNTVILITVAAMSYFEYDFKSVLAALVSLNTLLMIFVLFWYFTLSRNLRPDHGSDLDA